MEFRDKKFAEKIAKRIHSLARNLGKIKLMHVCGTHEDTITKYGLRSLLPKNIELVAGPGCPVCVTTAKEIDEAIELAKKGCIVTTFGDMLKVPGSKTSLAEIKSLGYDVRVVYSPIDAIKLAKKNPKKEVCHIAIGFETTMPATAVSILEAMENFSVLSCHRFIPPGMDFLLASKDVNIDGFINPGHVSSIIGVKPYRKLSKKYKVPQVISGFEPIDVLLSIHILLEMILAGDYGVENEYSRVVKANGNKKALKLISKIFKRADLRWRGFPTIPKSGAELKSKFNDFNAREKFELNAQDLEAQDSSKIKGCRCGDVLKGLIYPEECPLFGKVCKPSNPIGPCMVSYEGSCAIRYKYSTYHMENA